MTSISFAQVASLPTSGPSSGSGSSSGSSSSGSSGSSSGSRSSAGSINSGSDYIDQFLGPYLLAHRSSWPFRRYAYYLWFGIAAIFLLWTAAHLVLGKRPSAFTALQRKLGMRRYILAYGKSSASTGSLSSRKQALDQKELQPVSSTQPKRYRGAWATPTIAQLFSMLLILGGIAAVCLWGADYPNPNKCIWTGTTDCGDKNYSDKPPSSSYNKRSYLVPQDADMDYYSTPKHGLRRHRRPDKDSHPSFLDSVKLNHTLVPRRTFEQPDGWVNFADPLLSVPSEAIERNQWTASNRLGLIAFALTPLVVTLALKQWPFAIFATPFLMAYQFDKTITYHRFIGCIVWALSTGHVGLFLNQLLHDKNPYGDPVFYDMFLYWHFYFAIAAYVAITLMVFLSLTPMRSKYYEVFYITHMILGLVFLIGCCCHFPRLAVWLYVALGLWAAERIARVGHWVWFNGFFQGLYFSDLPPQHSVNSGAGQGHIVAFPKQGTSSVNLLNDKGDEKPQSPVPLLQNSSFLSSADGTGLSPPPGFAFAQLLPGRNIRMTIRTPHHVKWRSGQHVSLTVPSVSKIQGHPFTISNVCEQSIRETATPQHSDLVLLIGIRSGFTRKLWNLIEKRRLQQGPGARGVLLRAQIGVPFGTAGRTEINDFESVLIVCGGTGVSFGLAVLEHVCKSMNLKASKQKDFLVRPCKTSRVRFVWICREFTQLSWIATAIRKCLDLCSPTQVRVDICVTRQNPLQGSTSMGDLMSAVTAESALPSPAPHFVSPGMRDSMVSMASHDDGEGPPVQLGADEAVLDYVLFDGEEEDTPASEQAWSRQLQAKGKARRANSRRTRVASKLAPKRFRGDEARQSINSFDSLESPSTSPTPPPPPPPPPPQSGLEKPWVEQDAYASDAFLPATVAPETAAPTYPPPSSAIPRPSPSPRPLRNAPSFASAIGGGQPPSLRSSPSSMILGQDADSQMDLNDTELLDLDILSELARSGYPDLGGIMDDEQERSEGRLLVACCGPVQLNCKVRSMVAERIDPGRVRRGDKRGQISCMVEDFE